MAALAFLQIDALVPLPGASDVKEGFTRVPLTLCPAFSAQARALSGSLTRCESAARRILILLSLPALLHAASCRSLLANPPLGSARAGGRSLALFSAVIFRLLTLMLPSIR